MLTVEACLVSSICAKGWAIVARHEEANMTIFITRFFKSAALLALTTLLGCSTGSEDEFADAGST